MKYVGSTEYYIEVMNFQELDKLQRQSCIFITVTNSHQADKFYQKDGLSSQ